MSWQERQAQVSPGLTWCLMKGTSKVLLGEHWTHHPYTNILVTCLPESCLDLLGTFSMSCVKWSLFCSRILHINPPNFSPQDMILRSDISTHKSSLVWSPSQSLHSLKQQVSGSMAVQRAWVAAWSFQWLSCLNSGYLQSTLSFLSGANFINIEAQTVVSPKTLSQSSMSRCLLFFVSFICHHNLDLSEY